MNLKTIIEKQIDSLVKTIEENSDSLSMGIYIKLHRQLESYISTCYRYEILPLNEQEVDVKTIIEKRICAIAKKIGENSNSIICIPDSLELHQLLESYITTYKYYKI